MSRIFDLKKQRLAEVVRQYSAQSPVLKLKWIDDCLDEWRCVVEFNTQTLTILPDGEVSRAGPVQVGIRYHERFLSEAPHPFGIATVLTPFNIYHQNCAPTGAMCMGHPQPGLSLESILHQLWAGLTQNLNVASTVPGNVANGRAAEYVRTNASQFPITSKGLFESPDA